MPAQGKWSETLALGLIVAAVTGVVLVLPAGSERTSSAPDRYIAAKGDGFDGTVEQGGGRPRTAQVAALTGVSSVEAITFVFGGLALPDEAHRFSTEAPGVATTIMWVGLRPGVDLSVLYVGTESQELYGIDAATGALISRKPLGPCPALRSAA
jgi:hypothetical protein